MTYTSNPYRFYCKHCGRQWDTEGRSRSAIPARQGKSNATGFIASASSNHEYMCGLRTPEDRRKVNRRDEVKWLRDPPRASRIWNDPAHPGLTTPPKGSNHE